jgi:hypothetical protein
MFCPKCGIFLHFDEQSVRVDKIITESNDEELFVCKGCSLTRPLVWWSALELDINTKVSWVNVEEEKFIIEDAGTQPEELEGWCESPWCD